MSKLKTYSQAIWDLLKRESFLPFPTAVNKLYKTEYIEGYLVNSIQVGRWTYKEKANGPITEETIFIR